MQRFFRCEVVRHARACSRHCACLPARAGPPATAAPALSATRRQRRKVDKCRVADKKQTNRQTNKHTLLFYRADQGRLRPARAYGFVFERHQRSDFFVEKLYGTHARALAVHALARARARGRPRRRLLQSEYSEAALWWTNVVWPIKSRQTNRHTNTHYSFIGIDELTKVGSDQRSSTIQYDSKSKNSKRRQTVN